MVEAYFKFRQRPFLAAPRAASYFAGRAIEHARQTLVRCVERQQGIGLLVGPAGTGKSMLCQVLAEQFRTSHRVALLGDSRLSTRRCLWRSVALALEMPARGRDEDDLRLALTRSIESPSDVTAGLVLIVDEAQSLPPRLLEELRSLTNSLRRGQPRAHVVLAGGPSLEEHCAHPKLESLNQRIAARCYLQSFGRQETREYVRSQLAAAATDGRGDVFDETALEAVFRATDGVPRLINQVCDLALTQAADMRIAVLGAKQIEEAWAEIQQFPPIWNSSSATFQPSSAVVSEASWSTAKSAPRSEPSLTATAINGPASADSTANAAPVALAESFIEFGALLDDEPTVANPQAAEAFAAEPFAAEACAAEPCAAEVCAAEPCVAAAGGREIIGPQEFTDALENAPQSVNTADVPDTAEAEAAWHSLFGDGFTETQPVDDHYAALATRASVARGLALPQRVEAVAAQSMTGPSSEPESMHASETPSTRELFRESAGEISRDISGESAGEFAIELAAELTVEQTTDLIAESAVSESAMSESAAAVESPAALELPAAVESPAAVEFAAAPSVKPSAEEALLAAMRALPAVDDPRRWPPGGMLTSGSSSALSGGLSSSLSGSLSGGSPANPAFDLSDVGATPAEQVVDPDRESAMKGLGRPYLLSLPQDDRDLLVVDDEPTRELGRQGDTASGMGSERTRETGRARRQEYRLLFSRLRRG
jgi:type II secretory pathway predicted ATPase ExeA